ncbi:hypothetical protein GTZ89_03955 [Streptomyces sp. SID8382]|nr:helix-turn-helix domain-containing protein [Streptomyces sp. SID8382]AUA11141.1 hypothetical protein CFP59_03251 [Streptomyces sp. M56]MYX54900.1 hypothetical protein [Streptomyces sp. SID8382]
MADADRAPDPRRARSANEFITALQALKDWSRLTYRELSARADAVGDVLPRSTVANMLGRATLPREELVAAFVRACGVGPAELTVWLAVRKDLATRAGEPGAGPSRTPPRRPPPALAGRRMSARSGRWTRWSRASTVSPCRPPPPPPVRRRRVPGAPGCRCWAPRSG